MKSIIIAALLGFVAQATTLSMLEEDDQLDRDTNFLLMQNKLAAKDNWLATYAMADTVLSHYGSQGKTKNGRPNLTFTK